MRAGRGCFRVKYSPVAEPRTDSANHSALRNKASFQLCALARSTAQVARISACFSLSPLFRRSRAPLRRLARCERSAAHVLQPATRRQSSSTGRRTSSRFLSPVAAISLTFSFSPSFRRSRAPLRMFARCVRSAAHVHQPATRRQSSSTGRRTSSRLHMPVNLQYI